MKKYESYIDNDDREYILVTGTDREIRSLYRNLTTHNVGIPAFCEEPILIEGRSYGISFCRDDGKFCVVNASTALRILEECY